jgi:outer membrane protein assembly factor BamA
MNVIDRGGRLLLSSAIFLLSYPTAQAQEANDTTVSGHHRVSSDLPVDSVPDLRDQDVPLTLKDKDKGRFFVVPIPMSSPTFGTGLILGGAYYYAQTAEQKATQPSSFTGAAAGYTTNDSQFIGVMHQGYMNEDTWRFNAAAGYADFRLELIPGDTESGEGRLDWVIQGSFIQAKVSRTLSNDWYLGAKIRYLDVNQTLTVNSDPPDFNADDTIRSPGIGLSLEYDTRDMPSNPFSGAQFELNALTAKQNSTEADSYQSYDAQYRSFHRLADPLVLAWQVSGCAKNGVIPLWDTCRLTLRGFPITEYLSRQSLQGQAELRWSFHRRWGAVAFAGAGKVWESLAGKGEGDTIPSYGVGLRWMVLPSQRINVRVDYARSDHNNEAWYLSVSEAF